MDKLSHESQASGAVDERRLKAKKNFQRFTMDGIEMATASFCRLFRCDIWVVGMRWDEQFFIIDERVCFRCSIFVFIQSNSYSVVWYKLLLLYQKNKEKKHKFPSIYGLYPCLSIGNGGGDGEMSRK